MDNGADIGMKTRHVEGAGHMLIWAATLQSHQVMGLMMMMIFQTEPYNHHHLIYQCLQHLSCLAKPRFVLQVLQWGDKVFYQ